MHLLRLRQNNRGVSLQVVGIQRALRFSLLLFFSNLGASAQAQDFAAEKTRLKTELADLQSRLETHTKGLTKLNEELHQTRLAAAEKLEAAARDRAFSASLANMPHALDDLEKARKAKSVIAGETLPDPNKNWMTGVLKDKIVLVEIKLRSLVQEEEQEKTRSLNKERAARIDKTAKERLAAEAEQVAERNYRASVRSQQQTREAEQLATREAENQRARAAEVDRQLALEQRKNPIYREGLADQLKINKEAESDIWAGKGGGAVRITSAVGDLATTALSASELPGATAAGYFLKAGKATAQTFVDVADGDLASTAIQVKKATIATAKGSDVLTGGIYKGTLGAAGRVVSVADAANKLAEGNLGGAAMGAAAAVVPQFDLTKEVVQATGQVFQGGAEIADMNQVNSNLGAAAAAAARRVTESDRRIDALKKEQAALKGLAERLDVQASPPK